MKEVFAAMAVVGTVVFVSLLLIVVVSGVWATLFYTIWNWVLVPVFAVQALDFVVFFVISFLIVFTTSLLK